MTEECIEKLFTCDEGLKLFLELANVKDHDRSCCKHISHIIEETSKLEGPTILMVDEVLPWTCSATKTSGSKKIHDWSNLELSTKVDVIMAVSPAPIPYAASRGLFQVIPPSQTNIYTQQLFLQHRNFAELARLLSCVKYHHKDLSVGEYDNIDL